MPGNMSCSQLQGNKHTKEEPLGFPVYSALRALPCAHNTQLKSQYTTHAELFTLVYRDNPPYKISTLGSRHLV